MKPASMGRGGELGKLFLATWDPLSQQPLFGVCCQRFKVNIGNDSSGQWLKNSSLFSVAQAVGFACTKQRHTTAFISDNLVCLKVA
jgi:hypothetical protein